VTATGMELFVTLPSEVKGAVVAVPVMAGTRPDADVTGVDVLATTGVAVAATGAFKGVAVVATSGIELATIGAAFFSGDSTSPVQIGGGLALRVLGVEDDAIGSASGGLAPGEDDAAAETADAAARDAKLGVDAACNGLAGRDRVARGIAGDFAIIRLGDAAVGAAKLGEGDVCPGVASGDRMA